MHNLVIQTGFPRRLSILAMLLLGAPNLSAADADGKLVAFSSPAGTKAASAHAAAQRAAAKQALAPASGRQPLSPGTSWCQINGDRVNVRTGPGTQYQILATFHGGDYVKARATQDGWLEVDWPQNVPAWIGKEFVQTTTDAAGSVTAVATKSARVYGAGQVRSTVVAKLDPGVRVTVVGEEGNWYKIKAPDSAVAYLCARFALSGVTPPPPQPSSTPLAASTQTRAQAPSPTVPANTASAQAPASTQASPPATPAQVRGDLLAAIEQTRKELQASAPATAMPLQGIEAARIADETRKKAEAEEQARRDAETERLQEIEAARSADETRKKAEAEEQARRDAKTKRLQEIEAVRIADETRKKAEAEEQARREAEATMRTEAEALAQREAEAARLKAEAATLSPAATTAREDSLRDGAFFDPVQPALLSPQFAEAPPAFQPLPSSAARSAAAGPTQGPGTPTRGEATQAVPAPEPPPAAAPAPVPQAAVASPAVQTPLDEKDAVLLSTLPRTLNRINSRFIVPAQAPSANQAPACTERRAQVLKVEDEEPITAVGAAASEPFLEPVEAARERPRQVLKITAPDQAAAQRLPELPKPAGEPPPSLRLKPFFETQVRGTESGANVVTAEGVIERRTPSPVAGVEYALVQNGRTLHFLTAHADVNLEGLVGRRVSVTGVPLPSTAAEAPVLEVGTVSANE